MSGKTDTTRRELLEKIGSVGVAGVALSTVGSKNVEARVQERQALLEKYQNEARLRRTLVEQASTLKNTLVDEGFVSTDFDFESTDFTTDEEVEHIDPTANTDVTQVATTRLDGEQTAVILHPVETETHSIRVYVQPEREHTYARVTSKDSGTTFLVYEDGARNVTASCSDYENCTMEVCDVNYGPGGPTHTFVKNWYNGFEDSTGNCEYELYSTTCSC